MVAEEGLEVPEDVETDDGDGERRRSRLAPLLILLLVLAIIGCLFWRFLELRRAPDQDDRAPVVSAEMVRVPDVTGMTADEAAATLKAAGFVVEQEPSFDDLAEPGTVASQEPLGGTDAPAGSTVFLGVVARVGGDSLFADDEEDDGRLDVPRVIRLTEEQAVARLEREGFTVRVIRASSNSVPAGLVASQSPEGGARAGEGSVVTIVVSTGRASEQRVTVPSVRGLTRAQAEARIRAAGLDPRPMWQPKANSIDRVYQQSPAAGQTRPAGDLVFIMIGVRP
jgi:serine/threonine-protein kinase